MDTNRLLMLFLDRAKEDPRIAPIHLGLFAAILYLWSLEGSGSFLQISARKLMPLAKIGGSNLYHRSIRQLHEYGYIYYEPSFDPADPSRIYLQRDALPPALPLNANRDLLP